MTNLSASKIWQNGSARLFELVERMNNLAERLASNRAVVTHSGLNLLSTGNEIDRLPARVFFADWDKDFYSRPWSVVIPGSASMPLTNLDVVVDHEGCTDHEVPVTIRGHGLEIELTHDVRGGPHFRYGGTAEVICLERHGASCALIDYLNERPLSLHMVELGTLRGSEYHEPWNPDEPPFDPNCVDPIDFKAAGVCINTEVGIAGGGKLSIFEFIEARILSGSAPVVFCDLGSGEIADYIEIREIGDETEVEIYHCKSTKSAKPGARVDDAYEVIDRRSSLRAGASA